MAAPQGVQIDAVAVKRGHHRKAGEAALGRLRLANEGQAAAAVKLSRLTDLHPNATQRVHEPAHQGAPLENDVGFQKHVGLKGNRLAVGVDVGALEAP